MKLELALRWSDEPEGTAAAWLVAGGDPQGWLAALAPWGAEQAALRLAVVARLDAGVPDVGLLVIPPAGKQPAAQGVPYRVRAERLYLPLHARLEPALSDHELAALLPASEAIYVWHPATGLLAYSPAELRRVEDLLVPLQGRGQAWDLAQPGPAINRRLVSISPAVTMTLEQMMTEVQGDIGSQAEETSQLPPVPGEENWGQSLKQSLGMGAAKLAGWLAKAAAGLAGAAGAGGGGGGGGGGGYGGKPAGKSWIDALREWAAEKQQTFNENLAAARNRELLRLLDMLKKRPDEGLKFALPLAGDAARGRAPAGTVLGPRSVDFSLSGLGGGVSADIWNIEERYRRELNERYRELANREIALGRHRRAAYIFAQLLGDFRSAASTLENGKHYREAAVLFQERLSSDRDAARCLERGGLFVEAIALYEKLGEHEHVGDLYAQLGDQERADKAWQAAVAARWAHRDALGAAKLLEGKLRDPDGAYRALMSAWPASIQAAACLERAFDLLGSLGRHDEARRQVAALPGTIEGWGRGATKMLVEGFADVARKYPEAETRRAAADQTRVVVAGRLEIAGVEEIPDLTAAVRSLAEGDRLLARDCQRFLDNRRRKNQTNTYPLARPSREISLLRQFRVAEDLREISNIVSTGKTYFAAGRTKEGCLCFARGQFDGTRRKVVDSGKIAGPPLEVLLAVSQRPPVLYAHPSNPRIARLEHEFADPPWEHGDVLRVTSHASFDGQTAGIASEAGRLVVVYLGKDRDLIVVNTFMAAEGKLASSRTIALPGSPQAPYDVEDLMWSPPEIHAPLPMLLRGEVLFLGLGPHLAIVHPERVEWLQMKSPIRSIAGSRLHSRDRIAIMLEQGGTLLWGLRDDSPQGELSPELHSARAAFTDGGWLVAASATEIQVYHNSQGARTGRMTWLASTAGSGDEVLAALGTDQPNEVAVCTKDGMVRIYRLPKP